MGKLLEEILNYYKETVDLKTFSHLTIHKSKDTYVSEGDIYSYPTNSIPVYLLVVRKRENYCDTVPITSQIELCPQKSVIFKFPHYERNTWGSVNELLFTADESFLIQLNYEGTIEKEELETIKKGIFKGEIEKKRRGYDTKESKEFLEIEKQRILPIIEEALSFFQEKEENMSTLTLTKPAAETLNLILEETPAAASEIKVIEKDFGVIIKGDNEATIIFKEELKGKSAKIKLENITLYVGKLEDISIKNFQENLFPSLQKLEVEIENAK